MNRQTAMTVAVVSMSVLLPALSLASGGRAMAVSEMTQQADVIVLVQVKEIEWTKEPHPSHKGLVKGIAHCIPKEICKGDNPSTNWDVVVYQEMPDAGTSAVYTSLQKAQCYWLFLKRADGVFTTVAPGQGIIEMYGCYSTASLLAAADNIREMFKVLKESREKGSPNPSPEDTTRKLADPQR